LLVPQVDLRATHHPGEQREAGAFFGFAQDLCDVLECKTTVLTRDAGRPRQYTH
jgi:hypothetical protein